MARKKKPTITTAEAAAAKEAGNPIDYTGTTLRVPTDKERRAAKPAVEKPTTKPVGVTPRAKASVVRDKKTGRAIKAIPDLPKGGRTADPVVKKFKKGQLVTVKPRKQKKQTPIAKPVTGQIGKLEGKPVRVTTDNAEKVYDEKRTTVLPTATEADMTPAGRPAVEGVVLPGKLRSSQNKKNLGGFAHSHKAVASVAHEALGHLQTMAKNEPGTPEHHEAHEAFNVAHAQLGQISNSNFHKFMGMGRTIVTQHRGSNMDTALKVHRQGVLAKLEEGKIAEQSRGDRSGPKKEGQ